MLVNHDSDNQVYIEHVMLDLCEYFIKLSFQNIFDAVIIHFSLEDPLQVCFELSAIIQCETWKGRLSQLTCLVMSVSFVLKYFSR